jgi:hypothetical protein
MKDKFKYIGYSMSVLFAMGHCICDNTTHNDDEEPNYYPCLKDGRPIENEAEALYFSCKYCGCIVNNETEKIVGFREQTDK